MQKNILVTAAIVVVVGAGAFYGGMKYQQSKVPTFGNGNVVGQNGQFRRFGTGGNGGGRNANGVPNVGEILSFDGNSVTIKLMDGSSKIINVSGSTTISKTDTATKDDLKVGARIAAFGTANTDGSITAQNIQLNPMFRTGGLSSGAPKAVNQ